MDEKILLPQLIGILDEAPEWTPEGPLKGTDWTSKIFLSPIVKIIKLELNDFEIFASTVLNPLVMDSDKTLSSAPYSRIFSWPLCLKNPEICNPYFGILYEILDLNSGLNLSLFIELEPK